nr:hypothetical protein [Streptomyces anulatus]
MFEETNDPLVLLVRLHSDTLSAPVVREDGSAEVSDKAAGKAAAKLSRLHDGDMETHIATRPTSVFGKRGGSEFIHFDVRKGLRFVMDEEGADVRRCRVAVEYRGPAFGSPRLIPRVHQVVLLHPQGEAGSVCRGSVQVLGGPGRWQIKVMLDHENVLSWNMHGKSGQ